MKTVSILYAIILGVFLPSLLFAGAETLMEHPEESLESSAETIPISSDTMIYVLCDDAVKQMNLEDYLVGVLIGELPDNFEFEAMKAQAVAARTFAAKRIWRKDKHENCAVCTDSKCCQNYTAPDAYLANGGDVTSLDKYRNAVYETAGQVLVYSDELIDATYFSCSGGQTEDAQSVWGTDVAYLKSIASPGEEHATHYTDTVSYSAKEFQNLLGQTLEGLPGNWIGDVEYTRGGGVAKIKIGAEVYTGTQLRSMLGLYSTAFVISAVGDRITITTKGFGHRVGMSQYGADAMALQGSTFEQILAHYYPGTCLELLDNV